jgi:CDP-paratose 2-epimerase
MNSWLITGGCGFVGCNLADAFLANGKDVIILDNLSRIGSRDNLAWLRRKHSQSWRFIEADIRDGEGFARLVNETRPLAIAHLAGQVAMTTSVQNPRLDFETNALGTLNVLEAVRLHSPETVVLHSSTNKVYGNLEWVRYKELETRYIAQDFSNGFDETTPLSFQSPYGCSKGAADQYALDYARIYNLRTVVFRHSSMYGDRQFATYDQGWVGWFCLKAIEIERAKKTGHIDPVFTISGNGKQVRDILFSDDVVKLYLKALENIDKVKGEVFNIGGGIENSISLVELFNILEKEYSIKMNYVSRSMREGDQKVFIADIKKATELLGWRPHVDILSGIKNMSKWLISMR